MKIRTILLTFILVLMAVFLVMNWTQLSQEVPVNLLYTTTNLPLGLIVVIGFGVIIIACLVYMVIQQASMSHEIRAQSKEARHARQVAEDAEKSRLAAFQTDLNERLDKLEQLIQDNNAQGQAQLTSTLGAMQSLAQQTHDQLHAVGQARFDQIVEQLKAIQADQQKLSAEHLVEAARETEDHLKKEMFKDVI